MPLNWAYLACPVEVEDTQVLRLAIKNRQPGNCNGHSMIILCLIRTIPVQSCLTPMFQRSMSRAVPEKCWFWFWFWFRDIQLWPWIIWIQQTIVNDSIVIINHHQPCLIIVNHSQAPFITQQMSSIIHHYAPVLPIASYHQSHQSWPWPFLSATATRPRCQTALCDLQRCTKHCLGQDDSFPEKLAWQSPCHTATSNSRWPPIRGFGIFSHQKGVHIKAAKTWNSNSKSTWS